MGFLIRVALTVAAAVGLLAIFITYKKSVSQETFFADVPEADASGASAAGDAKSPNYGLRLHVIKVFDTMFHRNPTHNELEKYTSLGPSEQDVLGAIVKDYAALIQGVPEQPSLVPARVAEVPPPPPVSLPTPVPPATAPPSKYRERFRETLREARRKVDEALDMIYEVPLSSSSAA